MRYEKEVAWKFFGDKQKAQQYTAQARVVAGELLNANVNELEQVTRRVQLAGDVWCQVRKIPGQVIIEIHANPEVGEKPLHRVAGFIVQASDDKEGVIRWDPNAKKWSWIPAAKFKGGIQYGNIVWKDNKDSVLTDRHKERYLPIMERGSVPDYESRTGDVFLNGKLWFSPPGEALGAAIMRGDANRPDRVVVVSPGSAGGNETIDAMSMELPATQEELQDRDNWTITQLAPKWFSRAQSPVVFSDDGTTAYFAYGAGDDYAEYFGTSHVAQIVFNEAGDASFSKQSSELSYAVSNTTVWNTTCSEPPNENWEDPCEWETFNLSREIWAGFYGGEYIPDGKCDPYRGYLEGECKFIGIEHATPLGCTWQWTYPEPAVYTALPKGYCIFTPIMYSMCDGWSGWISSSPMGEAKVVWGGGKSYGPFEYFFSYTWSHNLIRPVDYYVAKDAGVTIKSTISVEEQTYLLTCQTTGSNYSSCHFFEEERWGYTYPPSVADVVGSAPYNCAYITATGCNAIQKPWEPYYECKTVQETHHAYTGESSWTYKAEVLSPGLFEMINIIGSNYGGTQTDSNLDLSYDPGWEPKVYYNYGLNCSQHPPDPDQGTTRYSFWEENTDCGFPIGIDARCGAIFYVKLLHAAKGQMGGEDNTDNGWSEIRLKTPSGADILLATLPYAIAYVGRDSRGNTQESCAYWLLSDRCGNTWGACHHRFYDCAGTDTTTNVAANLYPFYVQLLWSRYLGFKIPELSEWETAPYLNGGLVSRYLQSRCDILEPSFQCNQDIFGHWLISVHAKFQPFVMTRYGTYVASGDPIIITKTILDAYEGEPTDIMSVTGANPYFKKVSVMGWRKL